MVGSLSLSMEQTFGEILSPFLSDPSNVFVISSDFCHWGKSLLPGPLGNLYLSLFLPFLVGLISKFTLLL